LSHQSIVERAIRLLDNFVAEKGVLSLRFQGAKLKNTGQLDCKKADITIHRGKKQHRYH